eukprot:GABV01014130.1.p1 GENE.GABV01014130.1~~GABV01014130.1.p1  ORF type:complete len:130 (-),score=14.56 GABV01014130.1:11-361(-)
MVHIGTTTDFWNPQPANEQGPLPGHSRPPSMSFGSRSLGNPIILGSGSHDPAAVEETTPPGVWDAEMSMVRIADEQEKAAAPALPKLKFSIPSVVLAISMVWEILQLLAMPARSWH